MYGLDKNYMNGKYVFLDSNHTHFILIDDDSQGELGREIPFRVKLETELRKDSKSIGDWDHGANLSIRHDRRHSLTSKISMNVSMNVSIDSGGRSSAVDNESCFLNEKFNIPMILICVNGGYDAFKLIHESLKQRVPILVLAVRFFIRLEFYKPWLFIYLLYYYLERAAKERLI
jgi:hypothetical protein